MEELDAVPKAHRFSLGREKKEKKENKNFRLQENISDTVAGRAFTLEERQKAIQQFEEDEKEKIVPEVSAYIERALILIRNREYVLAQNILREVLSHDPYSPEGLRWMAHCFKMKKQFVEACTCFQQLIQVDKSYLSYASLGESYYVLEMDREALTAYQKALEFLERTEAELLFEVFKNMGNIYVRLKDFEAAEEYYNKAFTLNNQSDALLVNYGTLEIQRERLDRALERFREAVNINAQNDRAWVGLALVHHHFGDLELSWGNLERALDLNGENRTALELLIQWGVEGNNYYPLIIRAQNYLEKCPDHIEVSLMLAKIYIHVGSLQESLLELERTLSYNPQSEEAGILMEKVREAISQM